MKGILGRKLGMTQIFDPETGGVASVTVCVDGACSPASLRPEAAASAAAGNGGRPWSYRLPAFGALDYVSRTLTIFASDSLGNRTTEPLALPVRVDNVAPVLTASQALRQLALGRTATVLSGTVTDGAPTIDVSVRVQPPSGSMLKSSFTHRAPTAATTSRRALRTWSRPASDPRQT